ncbi:nitrogen fixation protein NifZ [Bradyrhizobium sp. DN5]|uniref:nitrogen fixation protein NifZ n=1 Tax=unclassified Bradyrhizobium TaxID=2631580 RepID=UPI000891D612|nr:MULTISPECIES: nitrogen fixation protein NifZ [unclassified Bradyrhizobium]RZN12684.1 nitrogen fixation protein NifZ [Bradyrhizobium genosp. SA-3]SDG84449.1 nitrogen fixation protein NifZ [Bradyrhizobium sp. Rc2d]
MTQPGFPKYRRGQRVKTAVDLINDRSFPNTEPEGVLLAAGATGEIINVAIHTEANVPIYIVDFGEQLLIGCLEEEITVL